MVATPTRPKAQLGTKPEIVWEKLPENFVLPDDPVDDINQPALAATLTDSLFLAGYLSETGSSSFLVIRRKGGRATFSLG